MKAIVYQVNPAAWVVCKLVGRFWPACLTSPLSGLSLREVRTPTLPPGQWVLLRTLMGGVCGTDLAIIAQRQPPDSILQAYSSMPMLLGHENLAVVEEVSPSVDRNWIGRRVCVEPTLCCGVRGIDPPCPQCRAGRFGVCENFGQAGLGEANLPAGTSIGYNSRTGGSFGEFFVAHVSSLAPVPDSVSDELAVLTDPVACSLHAALRADLEGASRVLVCGAGAMGLSLIACLRAVGYGGWIDAADRCEHPGKLAVALGASAFMNLPAGAEERFSIIAKAVGGTVQRARFGNFALSGGYDVVFDCAGSDQATSDCLKWTRSGGQMVMVATAYGGGTDLTAVWFKELDVVGAYGRGMERFAGRQIGTYQLTHELMAAGKYNVQALLTHTFDVQDYREAFKVALDKVPYRAIKVAFDFRRR